MKFYSGITLIIGWWQVALAVDFNVTCYYDTFSINRLGPANFTTKDLENALPLCDNLVYGYVGIRPETFEVTTLHPLQQRQFALVKTLKKKYRHVKFLLSLGGDKDVKNYEKYLKLLEATVPEQIRFLQTATEFVRKYKFDGLDLAYQLPRNFTFINGSYVSRKTQYHRKQMTQLIENLKVAFKKHNLMLTLTVLPSVDAKSYYNASAIIPNLDFVTLAAFDFSLPKHTPNEANYLAPLYVLQNGDLRYHGSNVNYKVDQWTKSVPAKKLNLGIATFGRTWNTTEPLKDPKMPIIGLLNGPAPGGPISRTPGLLAWPEICKKLPKISKVSEKMLGDFAYRPGLSKDDQGLLITYESPESALEKVTFAQRHEMGGVALFDLTLDDFRGKCRGEKFAILKTIKRKLN